METGKKMLIVIAIILALVVLLNMRITRTIKIGDVHLRGDYATYGSE